MSTYLRSWLGGTPFSNPASTTEESEVSFSVSAPDAERSQEDNDSDADSDRTDTPPAFPALNSAQRLGSTSKLDSSSALPKVLTDTQLMPPPPLPANALRVPGVPPSRAGAGGASSSLMPPPSASSTLGLPPSTNKPPAKKFREKVALAPGCGPLDWAALKSSGADLRGVDTLLRVTPSMLKQHNKKDDAWSAFNGKVYNITPYLPYHPGGEKELMRVAGRDGTKLFSLTHAWVNVEFMLDACLVGLLVSESYGS
ncbi:hypothetical protein M0805_009004 [Coniferiporia weirii]|nr:hypothetical protein M0805_009004 [Coniferiporia weirii]